MFRSDFYIYEVNSKKDIWWKIRVSSRGINQEMVNIPKQKRQKDWPLAQRDQEETHCLAAVLNVQFIRLFFTGLKTVHKGEQVKITDTDKGEECNPTVCNQRVRQESL